ncbi:MAG: hypothetical protein CEO21_286 [Microgenomates group bacterium Gr01-1014_80]|nr:MAG: hypothetical protein CEO21_286 [Microgenomates group bacterium Gr01-1014_80]
MTNTGGYQNLIVYQLAVVIFDLTVQFVKSYIDPRSRTTDQMVQAARSGKQNIVEGSLEKSLKMNIKLTGVARASLEELKEDYRDYLRTHDLELWDKNDPRIIEIRARRGSPNKSNWTYLTNTPERYCNLLITLISLNCYLLDQMTRSLERKFITEGGYSENLFKKRLEQRNKNETN